jgi:Secretion system C-terminal sorting domain/Ig-like domain CHU_C associated
MKTKLTLLLIIFFTILDITASSQTPVVIANWATIGSTSKPLRILIDSNKNLYTANSGSTTITRFTISGGSIDNLWDVGTGSKPRAMAMDANENIYTANSGTNKVSKITAAGIVTENYASLTNQPLDIVLNPAGSIMYTVSATVGGSGQTTTISKITKSNDPMTGEEIGVVTQNWVTINSTLSCNYMLIDGSGNLYVSVTNPGRIVKITPAGVVTNNWASIGAGAEALTMTFDNTGNIYTSTLLTATTASISKITSTGSVTQTYATLPASLVTYLSGSERLKFDPIRNALYLPFPSDNIIVKISLVNASVTEPWVTMPAFGGQIYDMTIIQDSIYALDKSYGYIHKIVFQNLSVNFNQTQPTCANSNNGGLRAIPSGTCGTGYQYLWTPGGATSDTISNLAPGTYNVRVVCGTDTVNKSVSLTASSSIPVPTTVGSIVDYTGSKTISQLDVIPLSGATLNFYYTAIGGAALAGTTPVLDDTTYFISQTLSGCESNLRKQIKVNRIANDSIVVCSPATVAGLTATPQAGNTASWFTTATGGTALASTTSIPTGTNTYYVEESDSTISTLFNYNVANNLSFLIALTLDENDSIYYDTYYQGERIYRANPDGTGSTLIYQGSTATTASINSMVYEKENSNKYLYFATTNTLGRLDINTLTRTLIDSSSTYFPMNQISRDAANNKLYFASNRRVYVKNLTSGLVTALDSVPSAFSLIASYFSPSTNSLYFGDYQTGKVYRKNLVTGVRADSISVLKSRHISQMPDGRIIIVGEGSIVITSPDLTNPITVATSTSASTVFYAAQPDSKGNIIFIEPFAMKKLTLNNSNRVPVTVIVNPTANVLPTTDTTVCNGSTIPAINFATTTLGATVTYNWTNDNTNIGLATSGTGNIASFVATNPSTANPTTATIIVTPTITNAGITCEGIKDTFLITVNPTIGVRVIANQVVCNGSPTTAVNFGGRSRAVAVTVYNWTNNTPSIGLAASGTGNIPSITAINNGNAPVTATIVVTPNYTNNGVSCDGTPRTFTITVNPTATVDTVANQIVCNGANATAINFSSPTLGGTIVYDWTNNNTNIGLATSGTDSIASFTATNTGTTPDTATIIVTPTFTNGGRTCTGTARTFKIIVNPTATVNAISNIAACNGSVVAAVTPSSPNTGGTVTYAWVNNNTAIGLAASGTGTIPSFTATNTGTSALTATIIVTPTFTNGAVSCVGVDSSYTITINPPPIFNTISNQVACNGSSTSVVPFSTSLTGGTSVFAWTNNNTAIGLAASGTGSLPSFTATNNTTAPISGTIAVVMTYTNAGLSCVSLPQTFTYTVNPTANVSLTNDAIVCNGATVPAANFTTTASGGTVTYSWTNDNTSIGLAASGTGNIVSFAAVNTGTSPSIATIIVTATFTNAGVNCVGVKDTFFITVNPTVTVNTISNQVVCNGGAVTAINFGTTAIGGTTTYAWTNNTTSIGLAASGTGNIPTFVGTNTGTAPVTATIMVTPTFTNAGISCVGTSTTFIITVNPTAIVNTIANQVVCNGTAVSAVSFGTTATGGTVVYNWTNNSPSIGLAASGTGNMATFNAVNTGTTPVTATITVTPTFTNAGTSCIGTPTIFTITVNPTATVSPISNKVECNGSVVAAVTPSSPNTGGAITYTWVNNNTGIGLAASGTGTIPSFTATNIGTSPVTATITITPTFTNGSVSCVGTNLSYTITVNPPPIFNTVANQAACNGAVTSVVNFSTALTGGTSVFAWTNTNTLIGLGASGTGNLPSFTTTNNTSAPISGSISVVMTYTNAGLSCISFPQTFTYTVNPTATVNAITSQVVCNGSPTAAASFTSPTIGGTIVYNWTNNTPSIGLAATGTGNIASFTAVNTSTTPVIATITVTPSYSNAGITCVGTSRTYTITVNPTATVNAITNQVVCNNSPTTAVNFTSPTIPIAIGSTIVYNWTNNTTSIGLAASGTGNIASFTPVNSGTAPVVATITVTPSYTNGGVTCVGTASTYTYTVNPTATVNAISNQVVCNGLPTTAVNFTSPTIPIAIGSSIVYNWTNNTTSIGLATSGTGNIASFNALNTGTSTVIATITVTPSFTNAGVTCVGTPTTFTITVNPSPIVTLAPFAAICKNAAPITLTGGSPVAGTNTTGIYLVDNVAQTIFNPANYTPGLHTIIYVFTNQFGCVKSATQTILVHPIHTVEISVAPNSGVATGSPATVIATVSPVDNYTYAWSKENVLIPAPNANRITVLANDAGNYKVTVTAPTGCVVVSSSAFTPSANVPQTLFIFPNPNTGIFNVAYNNGAANLTARTLNVYDALGQRIFSQNYAVNVPFGNMKVDISKYAKGIYYVELKDANGKKLGSAAVQKL